MESERYLRVVVNRDGVEYIAGLELRAGDGMGSMRTSIRSKMKNATATCSPGKWDDVANAIEGSIKLHWPDRAYFIEVGNENDGWVQIYYAPKKFIRRESSELV